MTLGNDNGTEGQTDRQTDRVRRNMRPPPREEGRIIIDSSYTLQSFSRRLAYSPVSHFTYILGDYSHVWLALPLAQYPLALSQLAFYPIATATALFMF